MSKEKPYQLLSQTRFSSNLPKNTQERLKFRATQATMPATRRGSASLSIELIKLLKDYPMFIPDLACLDFQECKEFPPATLMASLPIIREIRCALGRTHLNLLVGPGEAVLVSTDLYNAFSAWEAAQEEPESNSDDAWLN